MTDNISAVRKKLAKNGSTELSIQEDMPGVDEIWQQIQNLRTEMNRAKKRAAEQAAEPYLKKIKDLEDQYSMILKLSS